jgi:hypothetical protein
MNYQNKYLEYKNKYIELKQQIGGTRYNILKLLESMDEYSTSNTQTLPISYTPPQEHNTIA